MTKCDDIDKQLTAYLEGFLTQKDRKIVEEHLSLCAHCAQALEDLRRTRAILAAMDEVDPPPWLTERIMSQIREKEERKEGFFRKLFFPLHIKLPVQALATVFVAVLCVYVYRSTVPETGNFERPLPGPQVSAPQSPAGAGPADNTGKPSAGRAARQPAEEIAPKKKTAPPAQQPVPAAPSRPLSADKAAQIPPAAKDTAPMPPQAETARSAVAQARVDDSPSPSGAPSPSLEKAQRIKTRGMVVREEKSEAGQRNAAPPRPAEPQYLRARIVMVTANPSETARQAQVILRSLGGTGVEEKKGDQTTTVSGKVDADAFAQLKNRLKKIGIVDESGTRLEAGTGPVLVDILINRTADGSEGAPASR